MEKTIEFIIEEFNVQGRLLSVKENKQGNINTTLVLTFEENGEEKKYVVQKINTNVFKEPYLVMRNIELVTEHIKRKMVEDPSFTQTTLDIVRAESGCQIAVYVNDHEEREYYRMYHYIDKCTSYDTFKECQEPCEIAYNAGKSFGMFHRALDDFPISFLADTIPNFHNTPMRFNALLDSIENNVKKRAKEYSAEIVDLITKAKDCFVIWEKLGKSIPYRVTHNDTKLNNIMVDEETHEGRAIIDLDTIMPGSILFDIGDGIRSACANSFEDEKDPEKIFLNLDLTKAYLKGYLSEMFEKMTPDEIRYIALSIKTLTYELAIRFLTDYINGDTYFKIQHPKHNADRFLNQYRLLCDVDSKVDEIQKFVFDYVKELKGNQRTRK